MITFLAIIDEKEIYDYFLERKACDCFLVIMNVKGL